MEAESAFRQALTDGSVKDTRALFALVCPHLPQPRDDQEAAVMMHRARTEVRTIPFKARAYSHRWLEERGLPSGLPDELKPRAERMYPIIADAVGVAVKSRSESHRERASALQRAMSDAVLDCYANGDKDPDVVSKRMDEVLRLWRE